MKERRRYKRTNLIYYLAVFDRNTDNLIGYLANISSGGVMILSEEPLEINTVYKLKIELLSVLHKSKQIELDAKCVRREPDSNMDFYNYGFEFLKIDLGDIAKLRKLADKFKIEV